MLVAGAAVCDRVVISVRVRADGGSGPPLFYKYFSYFDLSTFSGMPTAATPT
jgi:hypothetical protein